MENNNYIGCKNFNTPEIQGRIINKFTKGKISLSKFKEAL